MKPYVFDYDYEQALFGSKGEKILSRNEKGKLLSLISDVKGQKILDLGTGSGRLAGVLVKKGAIVYGIDISREMLAQAKRKNLGKQYKLFQGNITDLERFKDDFFDKIICFRVLKYITEKGRVLQEVKRTLKNEGIFILEISNKYSFEKLLRWKDILFKGKSSRYDLLDIIKMERTLHKLGFQVLSVSPTTKVPHLIWRKFGWAAYFIDEFLQLMTPRYFLSRGLIIKARLKK